MTHLDQKRIPPCKEVLLEGAFNLKLLKNTFVYCSSIIFLLLLHTAQ